MDTEKVCVTEIRSRGQITIPKSIREASHLEEGQSVSIIPLGDGMLITPKRLELDEARRRIKGILKASGLSPKAVLEGLDEEREGLFEELYGSKKP